MGCERNVMQMADEKQVKKLPYPKSVFFIVSNEFCERFSYYGMRTILILYLTNILLYNEADAKIIYHTFTMFVYFFPVFGAIISDSWLGKFKTILYVSMIYACGSILLALSSVEPLNIPQKPFSILGLFLIALGTGGIKPCVSAFGGDQFVIPQQELQLATFFSLFYFSINAGSLISTFLTPILRNDVHCFDQDSCFPLAFAVPGVLMIISIVIFALGKPMYKIKEPRGNILVEVVKCIWYALTHRSGRSVDHWLDRSEDRYGSQLVNDIKSLLKVLVLYIPLPIFWALYDQQGSGWTFQAVRMNGSLGFYTILPDQMQVVNPLLILAFIPLFTYWIYPLLAKCHLLKTPLQRMCCGGFLAAAAFAISAGVSMALESTYPVLPQAGEAQVRIYDTSNSHDSFTFVNNNTQYQVDSGYFMGTFKIDNEELKFQFDSNVIVNFAVTQKTAYGIFFTSKGGQTYIDNVDKSDDGYPLIRVLAYDQSTSFVLQHSKQNVEIEAGNFNLTSLSYTGSYKLGDTQFDVDLGGTYTITIDKNNDVKVRTITKPNSVHILWLLPQYFVITAAEIMFSITGLEFSYSQAPSTMKSVLQALFLLTTAFGNLIIVLIESAKIFEKQSNDFFLYTGLMLVDMLVFMWLAIRYKYVTNDDQESSSESDELNTTQENGKLNGIDNPALKQ
ncbi:peptide transporter family 1 isoform X2 [Rhynchophorus ferrugineus]|uniref:peptide transporter family 1 isoform X2 n=1 Tax=Rhynchophorus ferrugineus TaxID=354439 RepID=UPI003FCD1123